MDFHIIVEAKQNSQKIQQCVHGVENEPGLALSSVNEFLFLPHDLKNFVRNSLHSTVGLHEKLKKNRKGRKKKIKVLVHPEFYVSTHLYFRMKIVPLLQLGMTDRAVLS